MKFETDPTILTARRDRLCEMARHVPFVQTFRMSLSFDGEGRAVWKMPFDNRFAHAGGMHGGVFATLLDSAGWAVLAPYYRKRLATIELQTRLLLPVREHELVAVGKVADLGRSFAIATMEIFARGDILVSFGSGTYALTSAKLF